MLPTESSVGKVIIIIDDIGYRRTDVQAFSLPKEVAFSILPQTPHARLYATLANEQGRDVMLHLPMASIDQSNLGPSALKIGMYKDDISTTLDNALDSVPFAVGVNNHMGSALTTHTQSMQTLMNALKERSLFFVDSRTTPRSIAYEIAKATGIPTDKRHVFLDHVQDQAFYEQQLDRLIRIAKKHGRAIGIAHPYPSSLAFLSNALTNIENHGVKLYPVSHYFSSHTNKSIEFRPVSGLAAPSE